MKFLSQEKLSQHKYKTPEGYLVCVDAILGRTGKQQYYKHELFGDSVEGANDIVDVDRPEKEVFDSNTLASFENKPVTVEHPDENVTVDNYKDYSVGFVRDVRRVDNNIVGNLVITDKKTIEEIENGEHTDLSCGYDCEIIDDGKGEYMQSKIRGNHVALCQEGRAGNARIIDSKIKDVYTKADIGKIMGPIAKKHNAILKYEVHNGTASAYFKPTSNALPSYEFASNILKDVEPRGWFIGGWHNGWFSISNDQVKWSDSKAEYADNIEDSIRDDYSSFEKLRQDKQFMDKLKILAKEAKNIKQLRQWLTDNPEFNQLNNAEIKLLLKSELNIIIKDELRQLNNEEMRNVSKKIEKTYGGRLDADEIYYDSQRGKYIIFTRGGGEYTYTASKLKDNNIKDYGLENIKIPGYRGTWYEIDKEVVKGKTYMLLEHEEYGDEAAHLFVEKVGSSFKVLDDESYDMSIDQLIRECVHDSIKDWSGSRKNGVIYEHKDGYYYITHKNGHVEKVPESRFKNIDDLYYYLDSIKDSKTIKNTDNIVNVIKVVNAIKKAK